MCYSGNWRYHWRLGFGFRGSKWHIAVHFQPFNLLLRLSTSIIMSHVVSWIFELFERSTSIHAGLNSSPKCQSLVFGPRQPLDIHPPYCRLNNLAKLRLFRFFLHFSLTNHSRNTKYKESSLVSIKMPMNEHANEFIAPVMYHILKQTMFIRKSSKKVHPKEEKRIPQLHQEA